MKKRKKGISLPFEWIFASIIGGIIIFVAIYAAVRGFERGAVTTNTQLISALESYLNPYETGLSSGQSGEMHFSSPSTIYFNKCDKSNPAPFGSQKISFTQEIFGKEPKKSEYISLINKYVFANESVKGKDFYIFSIPFFMAYKVSDLIIIYSDKYCFIQAPNQIKDQVENLNLKNINFSDEFDCDGIKVCFGLENNKCKIKVFSSDEEYQAGRVEIYNEKKKRYSEVHYIGNLVFAAIFSSEELYECNVKRLSNRFIELGKVYLEKTKIIKIKGCDSRITDKLVSTINSANDLQSSKHLLVLFEEIKDIKKTNDATQEGCKLFSSE